MLGLLRTREALLTVKAAIAGVDEEKEESMAVWTGDKPGLHPSDGRTSCLLVLRADDNDNNLPVFSTCDVPGMVTFKGCINLSNLPNGLLNVFPFLSPISQMGKMGHREVHEEPKSHS